MFNEFAFCGAASPSSMDHPHSREPCQTWQNDHHIVCLRPASCAETVLGVVRTSQLEHCQEVRNQEWPAHGGEGLGWWACSGKDPAHGSSWLAVMICHVAASVLPTLTD